MPITALLLSRIPFFQELNFFPGLALNLAVIPSICFVLVLMFITVKMFFKEWKYPFAGVITFFIVLSIVIVVNSNKANEATKKFEQEINEKINISKSTSIQILSFEEKPIINNNKLKKISFEFKFISNNNLDMNISPLVRFDAYRDAITDNTVISREWPDLTEVVFNAKKNGFDDQNDFFTVKANEVNTIKFIFADLNKIRTTFPGTFDVGIIYSIHISDPYGFGQGNATLINQIIDKTGKAEYADFAWEKLHFTTREYKVN